MKYKILAIVPALFLGSLTGLSAASNLAEMQRNIDKLQREIENEKQLYQSDLSRKSVWDATSKQRIEDMRTQVKRARLEADSLNREIGGIAKSREAALLSKDQNQKKLQEFAVAVADQVDAILAKMQESELPSTVEAKERPLRDISRGLRTGILAPEELNHPLIFSRKT